MSTIFLQKILKSRKLMGNHVIMRPQSYVWSKIGRSPPVNNIFIFCYNLGKAPHLVKNKFYKYLTF